MNELIIFVYNALAGGIIGNIAYDNLKIILGDKFSYLEKTANKENMDIFYEKIKKVLHEDSNLEKNIYNLYKRNTRLVQKHSGSGSNISIDSVVGNIKF